MINPTNFVAETIDPFKIKFIYRGSLFNHAVKLHVLN